MNFLNSIPIFSASYKEQKIIIQDVWQHCEEIIKDKKFDSIFSVDINKLPVDFLDFKKNIFSTLFISIFHLLKIPPRRRYIYGCLNQLFRVWVTSADNLLDNEDKITFDITMPGKSMKMRQVVVIMLADRVMNRILLQTEDNGIFTRDEIKTISDASLQLLLPSAAEEAMEEGGLKEWPSPEFVLQEIHQAKTAVLFHLPFLGPELVEKNIDTNKVKDLKKAMSDFGTGCQLLDDIRDLSRDYIEKKANYLISDIFYNGLESDRRRLQLLCQNGDINKSIADQFPEKTKHSYDLAISLIEKSLEKLDSCGLSGALIGKKAIVRALVKQIIGSN